MITKTTKLPKLVKKDFVAWATKATKTSLIQGINCPLERFLIAHHKLKAGVVCVGVKEYAAYDSKNFNVRVAAPMPAWAAKFVEAYDNLPTVVPNTSKADVLALLK